MGRPLARRLTGLLCAQILIWRGDEGISKSLPPLGQCHQLKEKYLLSRPKGFPLRGSCLRSRLKRCPRYTSFVYSDRRSYPSGDTSSDPLRGPPSPPRGRLLETAPLKLMTLPCREGGPRPKGLASRLSGSDEVPSRSASRLCHDFSHYLTFMDCRSVLIFCIPPCNPSWPDV